MEVVPCPAVIDQPVGTVHVYVVAFVTALMLYPWPVSPGHCDAVPLIVPGAEGVPGNTVTATVLGVLIPQLLPAETLIFPFCPEAPVVTVIEVVPCPAVIVQPIGTVHVYEVALGTLLMLYAWFVKPGHCAVTPVIVPGIEGVPGSTVTASAFGVLVPQLFAAVTLIFPFCPEEPVVTVIDVVPCPPVIDHPAGTDHVYAVALVTALML
jgi:hypothetical protein